MFKAKKLVTYEYTFVTDNDRRHRKIRIKDYTPALARKQLFNMYTTANTGVVTYRVIKD